MWCSQGSNLGPLLFLLYINDLPNCLQKLTPAMYADDTNLTASAKTIENLEEILNNELDNVHSWLVANKLTLNIKKTEYMLIGTRQRLKNILEDPKVGIGGNGLKRVTVTKSLGVLIDENLCWDEQVDNISKKVSKGIGIVKRAKPYISRKCMETLYHSLILPHFDYCSMVWGNCNQTLKGKLQKLQNRAARVISGDTYEVRSHNVLSKLGWKTLEQRRTEQIASFVTKSLRGQYPENISNIFSVSVNPSYNLRSNNNMLKLLKPKTNAMKRSFSYLAAEIWNGLPLTDRLKALDNK